MAYLLSSGVLNLLTFFFFNHQTLIRGPEVTAVLGDQV